MVLSFCLVLLSHAPLLASSIPLRKLSLQQLMELEVVPMVTSVSRKPEKATESPAAVFVITAEDIRRSGAVSLPEALRLAPGLSVSRIDGSKWAISARGANDRFSGQLLVLIDGRSVYSPLNAGVWWDVQDTLIEDVDRIEVVRGPGGTTWGANAVNGVINIITKPSSATRSGLVSVSKGTSDGTDFRYRYGNNLEGNGAFRFSFKTFEREPFRTARSNATVDDYDQYRFGFRADWNPSSIRTMTIDGAFYGGTSHEVLSLHGPGQQGGRSPQVSLTRVSGGHFRFLLQQNPRPDEELKLQFSFDRTRRIDGVHGEAFDTFDLDLQHRFAPWQRQEIVWGLGYRLMNYSLQDGPEISLQPAKDTIAIKSFFVQDQITLTPQRLFLTLGTKVYNHPYVGTENQPSLRLFWKPQEKYRFWFAMTEAHRVPSISERSGINTRDTFGDPNQAEPVTLNITNPSLQSETMKAKEVGFRFLPHSRFSLDLTTFQQNYSDLIQRTFPEPGGPPNQPRKGVMENMGNLYVHGVELALQWKPSSTFRLVTGNTVNWKSRSEGAAADIFSSHQWFARTYWNLHRDFELDLSYNDDDYETINDDGHHPLDAVTQSNALNARLGWRPSRFFELSIGGRYLLSPWHQEFSTPLEYQPSEIPRNYYLKATWKF